MQVKYQYNRSLSNAFSRLKNPNPEKRSKTAAGASTGYGLKHLVRFYGVVDDGSGRINGPVDHQNKQQNNQQNNSDNQQNNRRDDAWS